MLPQFSCFDTPRLAFATKGRIGSIRSPAFNQLLAHANSMRQHEHVASAHCQLKASRSVHEEIVPFADRME